MSITFARDVDEDRANGVKTLAGMLGPARSKVLYRGLMAAPFALAAHAAWANGAFAALPLLAAPAALRLAPLAHLLLQRPPHLAKQPLLSRSAHERGALPPLAPCPARLGRVAPLELGEVVVVQVEKCLAIHSVSYCDVAVWLEGLSHILGARSDFIF